MTLPFGDHPELEFWTGRGSIALVPVDDGDEASVVVAGRRGGDPEVRVRRAGNLVRVEVGSDDDWGRDSQRDETDVTLRLPREIHARVHAAGGNLEARDLGPCVLSVEIGAGRIALFDVYGRLRLASRAGQIAGQGIGGTIVAETNAGAILLGIVDLDPGDHHIYAGTGTIRLELARELDARVLLRPGRGSARAEFPDRQNAASVVHVETEAGSIFVRGIHASRGTHFLDPWPPRSRERDRPSRADEPPERPAARGEERDEEPRGSAGRVQQILNIVEASGLTATDLDQLLALLRQNRGDLSDAS